MVGGGKLRNFGRGSILLLLQPALSRAVVHTFVRSCCIGGICGETSFPPRSMFPDTSFWYVHVLYTWQIRCSGSDHICLIVSLPAAQSRARMSAKPPPRSQIRETPYKVPTPTHQANHLFDLQIWYSFSISHSQNDYCHNNN